MLFFAPVAAVIAVATGLDHGEFAHSSNEAFAVAWRTAFASSWFVGGGVLLATLVRHARLRLRLERVLIVLAVVAGFFIFDGLDRWATRYHTELMCTHRGQVECPDPVKPVDDTLLGLALHFAKPMGLYFAFGGGFAVLSYFKEQRSWREHLQRAERERLQIEKNAADLQLSILQAQVEPHFLFNTLASLRSLIRVDAPRAEAALDALVKHLRATLPTIRNDSRLGVSTLSEQLEICRSYLEVMRIRMGPRFSYQIEVEAELRNEPFPPFMLISLVENAIKHGVERKPGPCSVTIVARGGEGGIEVVVSDDGAGLSEGISQGVGLANIRAQLRLRFGEQASIALCAGEGGGAVATLKIPVMRT